jgi:hypothetical protein
VRASACAHPRKAKTTAPNVHCAIGTATPLFSPAGCWTVAGTQASLRAQPPVPSARAQRPEGSQDPSPLLIASANPTKTHLSAKTECKIAIAKPPVPVQVLGLAQSGRSVAWLARVVRVHEVVSSNLTAPTIPTVRIRNPAAFSIFCHLRRSAGSDRVQFPSADRSKHTKCCAPKERVVYDG